MSKDSSDAGSDQENSAQETTPTEALRAELEKAKNDYLYLRAEFDTYRRNAIKERSDLMKFGAERVFVELLNVLDNLERALSFKVTSENLETYKKGVEMTAQDLKAVLTKFGVREVEAQGLPFDPTLHEALSGEETDTVPEGHVFRVFKKPYKLHEKIIRPGQVVVAKPVVEN